MYNICFVFCSPFLDMVFFPTPHLLTLSPTLDNHFLFHCFVTSPSLDASRNALRVLGRAELSDTVRPSCAWAGQGNTNRTTALGRRHQTCKVIFRLVGSYPLPHGFPQSTYMAHFSIRRLVSWTPKRKRERRHPDGRETRHWLVSAAGCYRRRPSGRQSRAGRVLIMWCV